MNQRVTANKPRTGRTPRATNDRGGTVAAARADSPIGEAEPLPPTFETRLAKVVDLVEMVLETRSSGVSNEQFAEFARQLAELNKPASVTVAAPPGPILTPVQEQLALTYDAFRTALGRVGAASIILYRAVIEGEGVFEPDGIFAGEVLVEGNAVLREDRLRIGVCIEHGHVDDGSQIVVYGSPAGQRDGIWGELGRATFSRHQSPTWIGLFPRGQQIDRLEVLDRSGRPVRLGWQLQDDPETHGE
jgi:hypothetical protein